MVKQRVLAQERLGPETPGKGVRAGQAELVKGALEPVLLVEGDVLRAALMPLKPCLRETAP